MVMQIRVMKMQMDSQLSLQLVTVTYSMAVSLITMQMMDGIFSQRFRQVLSAQ